VLKLCENDTRLLSAIFNSSRICELSFQKNQLKMSETAFGCEKAYFSIIGRSRECFAPILTPHIFQTGKFIQVGFPHPHSTAKNVEQCKFSKLQ
jgi:hypothetical protein